MKIRLPRWQTVLWLMLGLTVAFLIVYAYLMSTAHKISSHPYFMAGPTRRPLVMAHQGGNGLWPGNTLFAFQHAAALGVDVLEMDIHSTADHELIVMHDPTIDRTTNGQGAISSLTLKEIKALDAGYRWTSDGGRTFPFRNQGITVPTLEEIFNALPAYHLNIEIKKVDTPLIAAFCRMIKDHGMTNKVLVASVHSEPMDEFRRVCPEVATSTTSSEVLKFLTMEKTFLGEGYTPVAQALQVPERFGAIDIVTQGFINTAHSRNMQVHPWTINSEDDMRRLIALGVDGIFTDYPDRLLKVIQQTP